jgi:hypothetical protein
VGKKTSVCHAEIISGSATYQNVTREKMKKLFLLLLLINSQLLAQAWAPKYPYSGTLKVADDSWWTHDKLTHALAADFLSREFTSITGNKYTGALSGFGLLLLWEVKDGYFNYRDFGAFGGDNFSVKDLTANALGCLHSLDWHESWQLWQSIFMQEESLGSRVANVGIGVGLVVGASMLYNISVHGKFFPHGVTWHSYQGPGEHQLLSAFNAEAYLVLPWQINSYFREQLNLFWRIVASGTAIGGLSVLNGYFDERDVPFLGDRRGYMQGNVNTGILSTVGMVVYELIFYDQSEPAKVGLGAAGNNLALYIKF